MKLLMRAAKHPLVPAGPAETLRNDTIGHNSGNLLFAAATHALLGTNSVQTDTRASFKGKDLAAKVNEEYDGVVIPLANCFRPAFKNELDNLTHFIGNLKIPFAMLSGGAQVEHGDSNFSSLASISGSVKAFCRAVLEHSTYITVRGEATKRYLNSLGFDQVKVIGCPSLTRMGPDFKIDTAPNNFGKNIAYNVETSKEIMGELLTRLSQSNSTLTYFPQDIKTLEAMFWSRDTYPESRESLQPILLKHPHFVNKQVEFYLDAAPWISRMRSFDMAIGPRIHGAVSAISSGTPALLIAHDLRTEELAEYHRIPFVTPAGLEKIKNPEDIWDHLDYADFNTHRREQVAEVVRHLEDNGFTTTLSEGKATERAAYFESVSSVNYHPPVKAPEMDQNDARFAELRRKAISLTAQVQDLDRRIKSLSK
ncbi:polysaccharide pyruvyl transferase family protein [Brevibacterium sediminis]|uniref:polysaccharide pyruvyl transferase family protein n=1 Tax=Brevibacterium sediminis TaxID=1857024 RepID=UPI0021756B2B|nr:polysaccharide pyruvyl transferase family protein [Brevibacterium sediminis]MCS4594592.1 polysaccharide pyruvyl transferase family protein [Brevibacterium sediminis]